MLTAIFQPPDRVLVYRPEKLRSTRPKSWAAIFVTIGALLCCFPPDVRSQTGEMVQVGFTRQLFADISENDVMAVARVWNKIFSREKKVDVISDPMVFNNLSEISAALSGGEVDGLMITTAEFAQLRELIAEDVVLCNVVSGSITEEYLLLANRNRNIQRLSDLKEQALGMLATRQASLASTWLDTLLLRDGMGPAAGFFGRIDKNSKAGDLVIPLFFGQLDACVVTRKVFDTMVELNPQIGKQLEVLASSPPVVPMLFCFRRDCTSSFKNQAMDELLSWSESPDRKQSLTIFQMDGMEKHPVTCLDSALALISEHQRLLGETGSEISKK